MRLLPVLVLLASPAAAAWEVTPMPSAAGFTDTMAWIAQPDAPLVQLAVVCDGQYGDFYLNYFTGDLQSVSKKVEAIGEGTVSSLVLSVDGGAGPTLSAHGDTGQDSGDVLLSAYLTRADILALAASSQDIGVTLEGPLPLSYDASFAADGVQDALREVLSACK